jgi:hypothetical protein
MKCILGEFMVFIQSGVDSCSHVYLHVVCCKTNKKLYLVAAGDDGEVVAGCLSAMPLVAGQQLTKML